jgi:hypothetical protein
MTNRNAGFFTRAWQTLKAWEEALNYSGFDYALDRIGGLEREVADLKDELHRSRATSGRTADTVRRG